MGLVLRAKNLNDIAGSDDDQNNTKYDLNITSINGTVRHLRITSSLQRSIGAQNFSSAPMAILLS